MFQSCNIFFFFKNEGDMTFLNIVKEKHHESVYTCLFYRIYRVDHLTFAIWTTGYADFGRYNYLISWQKLKFLFDIYQMGRFKLKQSEKYWKLSSKALIFFIQTSRNLWNKFDGKEVLPIQFVKRMDKTKRSLSLPVLSAENIDAFAQKVHQLVIVFKNWTFL